MESKESKEIGSLTEEELNQFRSFKREEDEITFAIGQRQREILALSMTAGEARQKSIGLMNSVRERLEIKDGIVLRVQNDGKIYEVIE